VGALQMAASEEEGIFSFVERNTGGAADPVADLVADYGAEHDREQPFKYQPLQRNGGEGRENPGCDEQRISREEKSHKEAGLHEDDGADKLRAARLNELFQSFRVEKQMEKVEKRLEHATWFLILCGR
jgi:hypothetical protein